MIFERLANSSRCAALGRNGKWKFPTGAVSRSPVRRLLNRRRIVVIEIISADIIILIDAVLVHVSVEFHAFRLSRRLVHHRPPSYPRRTPGQSTVSGGLGSSRGARDKMPFVGRTGDERAFNLARSVASTPT